MSIDDNSNDEWLGDNPMDFDDADPDDYFAPQQEEFNEQSSECAMLVSLISDYQEKDMTCYLEWDESDGPGLEAQIIYPTDPDAYIVCVLKRWKHSELSDIEVTTEWPEMKVYRNEQRIWYEPSPVDHFCYSLRSNIIECLEDVFTAMEENEDLVQQPIGISMGLLQRYQTDIPEQMEKIQSLVIDLLCQGEDCAFRATAFLNTGYTQSRDLYEKIWPEEDIQEARQIGDCRTHASVFYRNTHQTTPSSILTLEELECVINREVKEMKEGLLKCFLHSLRPTTSDAVVQNVVIPLHKTAASLTTRASAAKALVRLGYRLVYNGKSDEWEKMRQNAVS